jgi:Fic family protein
VNKPFTPQLLPHGNPVWEPLIPLIGQANRALAHYDGVLYGVPNPSVLLAPLTTQEAVLSSKIEGTQATLSDVLKFDAGEEPKQESTRLDIQEIANYRRALRVAEAELKTRPFTLNLLLKLHAVLLDSVRGRDKGRGRFRTVQNYMGAYGSPMSETDDAWTDWITFFLTALIEQAKENAAKARSIMDLYERLKARVIDLTRSKYAVPLLDILFARPIFQSSELEEQKGMPSKPMIMNMLGKLKEEGILKTVRKGSGRRAQILALHELIRLCESSKRA